MVGTMYCRVHSIEMKGKEDGPKFPEIAVLEYKERGDGSDIWNVVVPAKDTDWVMEHISKGDQLRIIADVTMREWEAEGGKRKAISLYSSRDRIKIMFKAANKENSPRQTIEEKAPVAAGARTSLDEGDDTYLD